MFRSNHQTAKAGSMTDVVPCGPNFGKKFIHVSPMNLENFINVSLASASPNVVVKVVLEKVDPFFDILHPSFAVLLVGKIRTVTASGDDPPLVILVAFGIMPRVDIDAFSFLVGKAARPIAVAELFQGTLTERLILRKQLLRQPYI